MSCANATDKGGDFEYRFRNLAAHLIKLRRPELLLSVRGRRYLGSKLRRFGYASSVLGDLRLVAGSFTQGSPDLACLLNLLDVTCWKARVAPQRSGSTELFAVEQALRARLGQFARASEQVDHLGTDDDRLIVHAELALAKARVAAGDVERHLDLVRSLSSQCQPRIREFVAARIASLAPETSVALACDLPEPDLFVGRDGEENPNRARCLWRIFRAVAAENEGRADSLLEVLSEASDRLYASAAMGHALIRHAPSDAKRHLSRVFSCLPDPELRDTVASFLIAFVGREFAYLPVRTVLEVLDIAHELGCQRPVVVSFAIPAVDHCIRRDSEACVAARPVLRSIGFRDMLLWRLRVHGIQVLADVHVEEGVLGADLVRADAAADAAAFGEDSSGCGPRQTGCEDSHTPVEDWCQSPRLLSALAERIVRMDRNRGRSVFNLAARRIARHTDPESRDTLAVEILQRVLRCDPQNAWNVNAMCGCGPMPYTIAARNALDATARRHTDRRESWLRACLGLAMSRCDVNVLSQLPRHLSFSVGAMRLSNDYLAWEPARPSEPSTSWLPELVEAFRRYIRGTKGNGWYEYQLHDAVAALARSDWAAFMSIVRDSEVSQYGVHLLRGESIDLSVLMDDVPPQQLLADVLALRKAKECKTKGSDAPMRELRRWILVCGTMFAPEFSVQAMSDTDELVPDELTEDLRHVRPEAPWSSDQIAQLLDFLGQSREHTGSLVAQAAFLDWLSKRYPLDPGALARLSQAAERCSVAAEAYDAAMLLRQSCPEVAAKLLVQALRIANSSGDRETLPAARLEASRALEYTAEAGSGESEYLVSLRKHLPSDEGHAELLSVSHDAVASAIAEFQEVAAAGATRLADAVVRAARPRGESDVACMLGVIAGLERVGSDVRSKHLQCIIQEVTKREIPCGPSVADGVSDLKGQVEVLTCFGRFADVDTRRAFLQEAKVRAQRLDAADSAAALSSIGDSWVAHDPAMATSLYGEALQAASRHTTASMYLGCAADIAGACAEYRDLDGARLAQVISDISAHDPFDPEANVVMGNWKAASSLAASICLRHHDPARSQESLRNAACDYGAPPTPHGTFYASIVQQAFWGALRAYGTKEAETLLLDVLNAFDESSRQSVCDNTLSLCLQHKADNQPMSRYCIWQHALKPEQESLIAGLLPLCSDGAAAAAHLRLAVHHMTNDRHRARRDVEKAVELSRKEMPGLAHGDFAKDLWTMYAATHGVEGCFRALHEVLPDPDNLRLNLPGIITAAVESVATPEQFLSELWTRLRSTV